MREYELAAGSRPVIGTEEQAGQGIGIDMALEPHHGAALDVQHDPVAVVGAGATVLCRPPRRV